MNFITNLFLTEIANGEPAGRETGLSRCSRDNMNARMTSALAPALSPKRGRIVRHSVENVHNWMGRTLNRKTRNYRKAFPLLGERAGVRAEVVFASRISWLHPKSPVSRSVTH